MSVEGGPSHRVRGEIIEHLGLVRGHLDELEDVSEIISSVPIRNYHSSVALSLNEETRLTHQLVQGTSDHIQYLGDNERTTHEGNESGDSPPRA